MTQRSRDAAPCDDLGVGLGGFLRSLLTGIPWRERADDEEVIQLETPPAGVVKLRNAHGRTRVTGEDRDSIEVRVHKHVRAESPEAARRLLGEIRLVADLVDDVLRLEVEVPRRWNRHGSVHVEMRVPRKLKTGVTAVNGKVCVEGMRASVRARSSNGSVRVVDVVGDVAVETSNAPVSCQCTRGRLMARSSNGKIQLTEHAGPVDASTSNGLIRASLERLEEPGVVLATSNGRIVLELPDEVDADVDLRVDNGLIRNDRDLEGQTRETNGRVRGRLGRGGATIKLRTSNGSISLR